MVESIMYTTVLKCLDLLLNTLNFDLDMIFCRIFCNLIVNDFNQNKYAILLLCTVYILVKGENRKTCWQVHRNTLAFVAVVICAVSSFIFLTYYIYIYHISLYHISMPFKYITYQSSYFFGHQLICHDASNATFCQ